MAELVDNVSFTPFEPKVKHRYVLTVDGLEAYLIKTAARPSISFEEIELNHLNLKRYVKGKTTWEPITISLYDPIVPSAAQQVMEWLKLSHEATTGRDGYAEFYKKDIDIELLGPVGDRIEKWQLIGSWIQAANFNDLDFTSNDPVDIELTIRYDYAILEF
tara:strand:- start:72 stop:554 length:483 start_codon:yes stop_codon:yes gene_type:complete